MNGFFKIVVSIVFLCTSLFSWSAGQDLTMRQVNELVAKAKNGDSNAVIQLQENATLGGGNAQFGYSIALFRGYAIQKNEKEAIRWLRSASKNDNPGALITLAQAYKAGLGGLEKSNPISAILLTYLAENGMKEAESLRSELILSMTSSEKEAFEKLRSQVKATGNIFAAIDSSISGTSASLGAENKTPSSSTSVEKSIWRDVKTGLTWSVCPYGSALKLITNNGDFKALVCSQYFEMTWQEAVQSLQGYEFAGFNDWRLPTVEELMTIARCQKDSGELVNMTVKPRTIECDESTQRKYLIAGDIYPNGVIFSTWTSSQASKFGLNADARYDKYMPRLIFNKYEFSNPYGGRNLWSLTTNSFLMVRGGTDRQDWEASVRDLPILLKVLADDKSTKELNAKKESEAYKRSQEQRLESLKKFQQNLKPGDRVNNGLVLEVRGDLVLIQRYKYENNTRYVIGNEWVKRSVLFPGI